MKLKNDQAAYNVLEKKSTLGHVLVRLVFRPETCFLKESTTIQAVYNLSSTLCQEQRRDKPRSTQGLPTQ